MSKYRRQDLERLTLADLREHERVHAQQSAQSKRWSDSDWEVVECIAARERRRTVRESRA